MKTLILGSQSPRRREIMNFFKIPFTQVSPDFDEEAAIVYPDPHDYSKSLAKGKVLSLMEKYPDSLVLGADSVVFMDGVYYSKPRDREEARAFIKSFSGKWQTVVTGLALACDGIVYEDSTETRVKFNVLSDEEIESYLSLDLWSDKAGGYTIVGTPSILVERIEGCFYNVLGFPVNGVKKLLSECGIDLWNHMK